MEKPSKRIVGFFRHAAQGLRAQADSLSAGRGGGKSSLAERLKSLWKSSIYVLKVATNSVLFESPLSLFDPDPGR